MKVVMNIHDRIERLEKELAELKARENSWEPAAGDYVINIYGKVIYSATWWESKDFGIERPTKELAERASTMMRKFNRLLAYHDEFCPEHDPAGKWGESDNNYAIYCEWGTEWDYGLYNHSDFLAVYFPEDVAKELCRKLNSGEVVL